MAIPPLRRQPPRCPCFPGRWNLQLGANGEHHRRNCRGGHLLHHGWYRSHGFLHPVHGTHHGELDRNFDGRGHRAGICFEHGGDGSLYYLSSGAINPPTLGQYSCGVVPNAEDETEGVAIDASGSLWLVASEGFVKEGVSPVPPCSGTGGGFVTEIEDRGGDVAIDGDGNAWVISGANGIGNLSEFSNLGVPISPSNGFVGIPYEPITLNGFAAVSFVDLAPDSSGNLWVIQQLYTGDYSHQMPYTFYAKEFIGISAPVVTPLSAGVKNHTLGSRP
jgi:hypothetical protein